SGGSASGVLAISLSDSTAFSITSDACTGTSLGPKKSCVLTVEYAPTTADQTDTATLTATGKKSGASASITLTGSGAAAVEPTVVTQVSSTFAIVNLNSITDQATLTGPNGTVTGSVAFFVCGPTGGATPCVSGGASTGTETLDAGLATSDAFTPPAAGTYCFRVEYTPDSNAQYSASVSSVTTNECFTAVLAPTPTPVP